MYTFSFICPYVKDIYPTDTVVFLCPTFHIFTHTLCGMFGKCDHSIPVPALGTYLMTNVCAGGKVITD